MKTPGAALCRLAASLIAIGATLALPAAAAAAIPVFDVTNYAQNVLQAARALDQINNQVRSLQNEAAMLRNMARNLETIDFPQLERMTAAMQRIDALMDRAQRIEFEVGRLDAQVRATFPGELGRALEHDERVAAARERLDAATAGYRRAMAVQAQVAENVEQDAGILDELVAASQGAAGALQVGQAANQLLALGIKQQLQLQNLMASEFRDSSIERARRVQAEEDGRAATRRFLGLEAAAPGQN
jgi:P-type conjugative transfer protein TrbJ